MEQATRALEVHKTIKGNHTAAKKSTDDAVKWTDHLVTEIGTAIDVLGQAVEDAQEVQAAKGLPPSLRRSAIRDSRNRRALPQTRCLA